MRIKHLCRCTTWVGAQCRAPVSEERLRIEVFVSNIVRIKLLARKRFQDESCSGCVNNILRSDASYWVRSRSAPPTFNESFAFRAPTPVVSFFDKTIVEKLVQFGDGSEALVM
jgi:hypothetical protein